MPLSPAELQQMEKTYHLLVVEDDDVTQGILREYLASSGYSVATAGSGEEFVAALESRIPDLVILDMHLSDMNGLQAMIHLKSNPRFRKIPAVLISGDLSEDLTLAALDRGAGEFALKPIRYNEVELRLRHILHQQSRLADPEPQAGNLGLFRVTLEQCFSDQALSKIMSDANHLLGEKLRVTVLHVVFPGLEKLLDAKSDEIAASLSSISNQFLEIVFKHDGSINQIGSDGFTCSFGYPYPTPNDAETAVATATEIISAIQGFNALGVGIIPGGIEARIGIATGDAFCGFVGSTRRRENMVLGAPAVRSRSLARMASRTNFKTLLDERSETLLSDSIERISLAIRRKSASNPQRVFGLNRI